MNDYRCRVSEDELAHDHAQVEIYETAVDDSANGRRARFESLLYKVTLMSDILFENNSFIPDDDDLNAVQFLHNELKYYDKVKK
jgi:hypothetical protein